MKIFLLEDELMLQRSIEEYISELGYSVVSCSDGKVAKENLETNTYDLLLLDINVPNFSGMQLLDTLQTKHNFTPAIFISADTSIDTISQAFERGAIDYLKKPFHLKELGLRIQKEMAKIDQNKNINIQLTKNYAYNQDENMLYFNNEFTKLTNKKIQIVRYLALNIGRIITIDTLREYIWQSEPVSDATIRAEMSRLKKLLQEDFIKNIKGVGYTIEKYIPEI